MHSVCPIFLPRCAPNMKSAGFVRKFHPTEVDFLDDSASNLSRATAQAELTEHNSAARYQGRAITAFTKFTRGDLVLLIMLRVQFCRNLLTMNPMTDTVMLIQCYWYVKILAKALRYVIIATSDQALNNST